MFLPFKRINSISLFENKYDWDIEYIKAAMKLISQIDFLYLIAENTHSREIISEPMIFKDKVDTLSLNLFINVELTEKSLNNIEIINPSILEFKYHKGGYDACEIDYKLARVLQYLTVFKWNSFIICLNSALIREKWSMVFQNISIKVKISEDNWQYFKWNMWEIFLDTTQINKDYCWSTFQGITFLHFKSLSSITIKKFKPTSDKGLLELFPSEISFFTHCLTIPVVNLHSIALRSLNTIPPFLSPIIPQSKSTTIYITSLSNSILSQLSWSPKVQYHLQNYTSSFRLLSSSVQSFPSQNFWSIMTTSILDITEFEGIKDVLSSNSRFYLTSILLFLPLL